MQSTTTATLLHLTLLLVKGSLRYVLRLTRSGCFEKQDKTVNHQANVPTLTSSCVRSLAHCESTNELVHVSLQPLCSCSSPAVCVYQEVDQGKCVKKPNGIEGQSNLKSFSLALTGVASVRGVGRCVRGYALVPRMSLTRVVVLVVEEACVCVKTLYGGIEAEPPYRSLVTQISMLSECGLLHTLTCVCVCLCVLV